MTKLSFCVVSYNNADKIQNVINNIEDIVENMYETEIFIIDNVSTDDTVDKIRDLATIYNNVHLIISEKNNGFASGNNKCLKYLNSKYHFIVNPDILIDNNDTLKTMVKYLDEHEEVGMLSPKILNMDGSIQKLYKRNPTVLDMAIRFISPNFMKKRQKWFIHDETKYMEIGPIDYASGAFMVFRTSLFKKIGGFDDRYFMYLEDADITRKVNLESKAVFLPTVYVKHEWQRESHKKIRYIIITIDSMVKYFRKWGLKLW